MTLNNDYNYRFIWPNKDIQEKLPECEYQDTFQWLNTLSNENKSNILIVSWWRELIYQEVEKHKERIKAIISRWVWVDNFWDLSLLGKQWILVWNNPEHSQYNTFLHSIWFLYKACEFLWVSNLEELQRKNFLVIWRWTISQTIVFFLQLLWCYNIERISSLKLNQTSLHNTDICFVATSLQPENIKSLNAFTLSCFTWVLINVSREKLVNEDSVYDRVKLWKMWYISDVSTSSDRFQWFSNTFFTNHVGWRSTDIDFVIKSLVKNVSLVLDWLQVSHTTPSLQKLYVDWQLWSEEITFNLLEQAYNEKIVHWRTISSWVYWKIKEAFL